MNGRRAADSGELIELGLGTFLMSGNGANAMMGPTPYAVVEVKRGLYVRPAVIVGQSLVPLGDSTNVNAFFLAGRLEACARFPGNYMPNRGLELAVCGGADAGYTYFHAAPAGYTSWGAPREATILPQVSAGPSLDLRGELGAGWSLVLRGMAGVNTIRTGFDDSNGGRVTPSWVTGRIELAFAWRLR